ncbi:MAG: GntR family transcriptional regulator [Methylococcaceae bacterium]|nr:GntR family transcriptional regulator [Methylococcaceae bacterium]
MIEIGKFNQLKVNQCGHEVYLDGDEFGDILLPTNEVPEKCKEGDSLNVFVYSGRKGQLSATFHTPKAQVDEIAWLKVVEIGQVGAFLDWGLSKDLLVPFNEQRSPLELGQSYLVKIFLDDNDRIAATTRFEHFLIEESIYFKEGQEVDIIIVDKTDLGFKAIVDNSHWGVLYNNEIFQPLRKGRKLKAYIKKIREDKKIDLSLQPLVPVHTQTGDLSDKILNQLIAQNGHLPLGDKSPPEEVYRAFGVSKKAFKQAVGALYKKQLIDTDKHSITLRKEERRLPDDSSNAEI